VGGHFAGAAWGKHDTVVWLISDRMGHVVGSVASACRGRVVSPVQVVWVRGGRLARVGTYAEVTADAEFMDVIGSHVVVEDVNSDGVNDNANGDVKKGSAVSNSAGCSTGSGTKVDPDKAEKASVAVINTAQVERGGLTGTAERRPILSGPHAVTPAAPEWAPLPPAVPLCLSTRHNGTRIMKIRERNALSWALRTCAQGPVTMHHATVTSVTRCMSHCLPQPGTELSVPQHLSTSRQRGCMRSRFHLGLLLDPNSAQIEIS